jgi:hypothetical protein
MAITRFAGTFNALDFAYGVVGGTGAPPLQVTLGSTSTGAYTITCSPNALYTSSGIAIPISTATPINVGGGSNQDLNITPTTVSQSGQNTLLITATFTYAHGPGAQVSSGTFGLAEAMLSASKYGGGTVTVDAKWFAAGGTYAIIDAATQYAGVTIQDNSGSVGQSTPETTTVTLSNAQILTLSTVPVNLLPNPDANSYYQILQAVLFNLNTGVAYAGSPGVITIGWGTTTATTDALSGTVAATFLTTPTSTYVTSLAGAEVGAAAATTYLGKGIWMNVATNNPTTGTGTMQVTLSYIKIYT